MIKSGFICPECHLTAESAGALAAHFHRHHGDEGQVRPARRHQDPSASPLSSSSSSQQRASSTHVLPGTLGIDRQAGLPTTSAVTSHGSPERRVQASSPPRVPVSNTRLHASSSSAVAHPVSSSHSSPSTATATATAGVAATAGERGGGGAGGGGGAAAGGGAGAGAGEEEGEEIAGGESVGPGAGLDREATAIGEATAPPASSGSSPLSLRGQPHHHSLSIRTFAAPAFSNQPACRVCSAVFGYQRMRHHCRNCGASCCLTHSKNMLSLPHIGYRSPVRVCDVCFEDIMQARQGGDTHASHGVVLSGRLTCGGNEVLVKLSHLSISIFLITPDDDELSFGKLLSTMHLADIISIRRVTSQPRAFSIGDTEGDAVVLAAPSESEARRWLEGIVATKNELLDAVRQLGAQRSGDPRVWQVTASDPVLFGAFDVVVSRNVGFRAPFRLPFLHIDEAASITVHLEQGFFTISGAELLALSCSDADGTADCDGTAYGGSDTRDAEADENDVENSDEAAWFQSRPYPSSLSSARQVEVRVEVEIEEGTDLCPLVFSGLVLCRWFGGQEAQEARELECIHPLARWVDDQLTAWTPTETTFRLGALASLAWSLLFSPWVFQWAVTLPTCVVTIVLATTAILLSLLMLILLRDPSQLRQRIARFSMTLAEATHDHSGRRRRKRRLGMRRRSRTRSVSAHRGLCARSPGSAPHHGPAIDRETLLAEAMRRRRRSVSTDGAAAAPGGGGRERDVPLPPPTQARSVRAEDEEGDAGGGGGDEGSASSAMLCGGDATEGADVLGCPRRFVRMVRGDVEEARRQWRLTEQWRAQHRPEKLLRLPRPAFRRIKAAFTHFFHKTDRLGRLVYYEALDRPRQAFQSLKADGISVDDVVEHMTFINEYCYRFINCDYDEEGVEPKATGQLIKVMDIKGVGLTDVGGEVMEYFRKIGAMGRNYPERVDRIFVINVPTVFGIIWKMVAPMLDRNVRERITIHRGAYLDALAEVIDPADIPVEFGGTCRCGESCRFCSPQELELAKAAEQCTKAKAGGVDLANDLPLPRDGEVERTLPVEGTVPRSGD